MADVAQKCIAVNDVKNNSRINWLTKDGIYQSEQRGINRYADPSDLDTKYTNRFDDITYYTS